MAGLVAGLGFAGGLLSTLAGQEDYIGRIGSIKAEQRSTRAQITERERQLRIEKGAFKRKADIAFGDTVSSFAKAGVDLSESPMMILADQKNEFKKTLSNIQAAGEADIALLKMGVNALDSQLSSTRRAQGLSFLGGSLGLLGAGLAGASRGQGGASRGQGGE